MGAFTNITYAPNVLSDSVYGINGKEMNPCRKALRDLMKELLIAIPEILLVRDSPLLQAYNNAVDALAADDVWEKQMQDYFRIQQAYKAAPTYAQPNPVTPNTWPTWTMPNTTSGGAV